MSRFSVTFHQTFLSLRNRNFKLYFFGQLISNSGNWLTNVALTLLVLHLTNKGSAVGLIAACQYGPILLLTVWAGSLVDRANKRMMLFVTQGLEMLESCALAALAFMHHPPIAALYVVTTIGGVLLAFDNPLRRTFVSEMVPKEDIPNAVALYSAIVNVSRAVGPALAGILVITVGYGWCFTLDAASYVAVLVCLLMMRASELYREPIVPRVKGAVRAGFRYAAATPFIRIPFIMLAIIGTLAYNFTVTLPLFVTHSLHGSAGAYTALYSLFGFGALVSALIVANRKSVTTKDSIVGAALLGITMLLLSIVPNVIIAAPLIFLLGITSIMFMNAISITVQVDVAPAMRGRILALQAVLFIGTTPFGGPLLGSLADKYGARFPIIIGGISCLVAVLFGYIANRRLLSQGAELTTD